MAKRIHGAIGQHAMQFVMSGSGPPVSERFVFQRPTCSRMLTQCFARLSQRSVSVCPSTILRMVPLPETSSGRIERRLRFAAPAR